MCLTKRSIIFIRTQCDFYGQSTGLSCIEESFFLQNLEEIHQFGSVIGTIGISHSWAQFSITITALLSSCIAKAEIGDIRK